MAVHSPRLETPAILIWFQRPGEFLGSHWSSAHLGRLKKLGSDAGENGSNHASNSNKVNKFTSGR